MEPDLPPNHPAPDAPEPSTAPADDPAPGAPDDGPPAAAAPDSGGLQDETPPAADHDPAGGAEATPPPPPPPPPGEEPPPAGGGGVWAPPFQILRSRHDRKLGGVAGGLAAAADLDATVVRLAVVLGCLTGWGILAYLIAWAVIPEEDPARGRYLVPAPERTARNIRIGLAVVAAVGVLHIVGAILGILGSALIGLGLFPARIFGLSHRGFMPGEALLGLFLLVGGLLLLFRRHLPGAPAAGGPGPGAGAGSWSGAAPPAAGMALATVTPGSGGGGATAGGYVPPPPPPGGGSGPGGFAGRGSGGAGGFGARASAAARAARVNGPLLLVRAIGWLVALWFLAAVVIGAGFWVTGALHVHLPVLPTVTSLAALGFLAFTLIRSRRVAAVIGAIALLLVPAGLAAALTRIDGQAGHRHVTPIVMADLEPTYRHAAGVFELDLSRLPLPAGQTPLQISMGAGKIDVTVPWDADVQATASVGAGSFDLFGNRQSGVNLKGRTHSTGQPGAPTLVIRGRAGAGEIEVSRAAEPYTHEALRTGQPIPMQCDVGASRSPAGGGTLTGPVRCSAADGVTVTPALNCVVSDGGAALCRPVGEPEPSVGFANDPGTRHCQVPAGGGEAACTAPVPGKTATGGGYTCTIPSGGGDSVCRQSNGTATTAPAPADPNAPAPPAPPAPPAAPGEYHCTVPEGGGPATCEPA